VGRGGIGRRAVHRCDSHLYCVERAARCPQTGAAHTPSPSEQTHPQSSRCTPRCPSVVLWTPCSGCGVARVFEPASRVGSGKAACEPGRRGCGGVPLHPARLPTHRTSPAQALLTSLARRSPASPTFDLLSRTATVVRGCPVCTSGSLRAERGWVTGVNGAPQWVWAATTVA
jgi:hypothetical protein